MDALERYEEVIIALECRFEGLYGAGCKVAAAVGVKVNDLELALPTLYLLITLS